MSILAIDPGGTTGFASREGNVSTGVLERQWQYGPEEHHADLWDFLRGHEGTIVCESFQYRNGLDKAVLISNEYIGIIKLAAKCYGMKLVFQTPSQAVGKKAFWSDAKIKHLGLWKSNMPHAMDATRHMLYYITFTLHDDFYLKRLAV